MRFTATILFLLSLTVTLSHAANFSLTVKRDTRRVIDLGVFGYSGQGTLLLTIKDFVLHDVNEYTTSDEKIGFTLDMVATASAARQELSYAIKQTKKDVADVSNLCFVDDPTIAPAARYTVELESVLSKIASERDDEPTGEVPSAEEAKNNEQHLRKAIKGKIANIQIPEAKAGLYALFYYSCKKKNKNKDPLHVSFSVDVSQYRITDPITNVRNYLSVGEAPLPVMNAFFALVFIGGAVWWHRLLFRSSPQVTESVRSVHYFMYGLLYLKITVLVLHAVMMYRRQVTGKMHGGWDYLYYFFQTVKGIALFALIVLLGTGWSLLKPFLTNTDQRILMLVLPLQVMGNIAQAVIEEQSEGTRHWSQWRDALRLFDVACCCAVLLPLVWSIRSLRDSSSATKAAQRSLVRLRQFRTFYIASVGFIYFTRIVIEFLSEYIPFRHLWLTGLLYEVGAVSYYGYVGWLFQPQPESRARLVDEDAEANAEMEAQEDVQDIDLEAPAPK